MEKSKVNQIFFKIARNWQVLLCKLGNWSKKIIITSICYAHHVVHFTFILDVWLTQ